MSDKIIAIMITTGEQKRADKNQHKEVQQLTQRSFPKHGIEV